jgi:hypothetical protein
MKDLVEYRAKNKGQRIKDLVGYRAKNKGFSRI